MSKCWCNSDCECAVIITIQEQDKYRWNYQLTKKKKKGGDQKILILLTLLSFKRRLHPHVQTSPIILLGFTHTQKITLILFNVLQRTGYLDFWIIVCSVESFIQQAAYRAAKHKGRKRWPWDHNRGFLIESMNKAQLHGEKALFCCSFVSIPLAPVCRTMLFLPVFLSHFEKKGQS